MTAETLTENVGPRLGPVVTRESLILATAAAILEVLDAFPPDQQRLQGLRFALDGHAGSVRNEVLRRHTPGLRAVKTRLREGAFLIDRYLAGLRARDEALRGSVAPVATDYRLIQGDAATLRESVTLLQEAVAQWIAEAAA